MGTLTELRSGFPGLDGPCMLGAGRIGDSSRVFDSSQLAVIGGGPAGLRAAEVAAGAGLRVVLYDGKPSVGRKFLVAGRGGLNLTLRGGGCDGGLLARVIIRKGAIDEIVRVVGRKRDAGYGRLAARRWAMCVWAGLARH